jgi:RND family efflux transporter MFP subunit
MPVDVVTMTAKPIERTGEFVGTVRSRRSTTIQPQAEGILTRIAVRSGDRVNAGDLLFEIDAAPQQAGVASLESIRAAREADAALARGNAERARKLLEVGAISQQELDQAMTLQKTTEAQLKATEEQIRQQRAELAYYKVVAPTSGIVGDIPVRQGDRITRATMLTTVDEAGQLELYVGVPVQQAPNLKPGLAVRVLDDQGTTLATERINFIAPSVDDQTQTVLVKTPLSARPGQFRTDQLVRVQVVFDTAPGLTVPVTAVTRINAQYFAFAVEGSGANSVARQRALTVGPVIGNDYVLLSGFKEGERLIVSGIQKIGDGMPVSPTPAKPAMPDTPATPAGGA